jgi:hypothetical protein
LFCCAQATEYYINPLAGNDLNDGSAGFPWKTLSHGFSVIQPGDVLSLFDGNYQPFSDIPGGTPGLPVTIKSADGHRARITNPNINNGILITNNYVIIDGLEIGPVKSNGVNIQANYVIVRNCIIHDTGLALKANTSYVNHHILMEYCSIYNFSDIGIFPDAVDKMIIRNNVMYNSQSVMMDPGGVQEMLIENNFVINPGKPLGALKIRWGNVEDVSGPNCNGAIVRNNIFLEGDKYNLLLASANGAMVYNNVMINNMLNGSLERAVVYMQRDPADINEGKPLGPNQRNVLKNNIFQVNGADSETWMHHALIEAREDMVDDIKTNEFDNNLYYKSPGKLYIVSGTELFMEDEVNGWGEQFDLNSIVGHSPELQIKDSLESVYDFMPAPSSPVIDSGSQLTVTLGSGSSDVIPVEDSRYFYSGHGMISGDAIIIGTQDTATVIDRDIIANTITLNKVMTWAEGDSVSLLYSGTAPDIGVFERGLDKEIANAAGADELFRRINSETGVNSIVEENQSPADFYLSQNYPNPFNPATTIQYRIGKPQRVKILVYDITGGAIKILVNERQAAGRHYISWDGSNMMNQKVSSGLYFYQIQAGIYSQTRKMILLR